MPPSTKDCYERLARAAAHLEELDAIVARFRDDNLNPVTLHPEIQLSAEGRERIERDGFTDGVFFEVPEVELPEGIRAVVGDIVQNCRIPLDYMVYQLAWLDSGVEQEGTQFPIFWARKYFRSKEPTYLRGVKPAHRHAIELLQPYKGGKWLSVLAGLANPDKHKTFLAVRNGAQMTGSITVTDAQTVVGQPGRSAKVDLQFTPVITLPNGAPVDDGLREIHTAVRALVEEFDPCFSGGCVHREPPTAPAPVNRRSRGSRGRRGRASP